MLKPRRLTIGGAIAPLVVRETKAVGQKIDRIAKPMDSVVHRQLKQGSMMDCASGIAMSVSSEAKCGIPSGGLGRDPGILRVARPAGPLPEAVPLPRQVVLGLPPQPGIGRAPACGFQLQGQRH